MDRAKSDYGMIEVDLAILRAEMKRSRIQLVDLNAEMSFVLGKMPLDLTALEDVTEQIRAVAARAIIQGAPVDTRQ